MPEPNVSSNEFHWASQKFMSLVYPPHALLKCWSSSGRGCRSLAGRPRAGGSPDQPLLEAAAAPQDWLAATALNEGALFAPRHCPPRADGHGGPSLGGKPGGVLPRRTRGDNSAALLVEPVADLSAGIGLFPAPVVPEDSAALTPGAGTSPLPWTPASAIKGECEMTNRVRIGHYGGIGKRLR